MITPSQRWTWNSIRLEENSLWAMDERAHWEATSLGGDTHVPSEEFMNFSVRRLPAAP